MNKSLPESDFTLFSPEAVTEILNINDNLPLVWAEAQVLKEELEALNTTTPSVSLFKPMQTPETRVAKILKNTSLAAKNHTLAGFTEINTQDHSPLILLALELRNNFFHEAQRPIMTRGLSKADERARHRETQAKTMLDSPLGAALHYFPFGVDKDASEFLFEYPTPPKASFQALCKGVEQHLSRELTESETVQSPEKLFALAFASKNVPIKKAIEANPDFFINSLNYWLWNHQQSNINLSQLLIMPPCFTEIWKFYLKHQLDTVTDKENFLALCRDFWKDHPAAFEKLLPPTKAEKNTPKKKLVQKRAEETFERVSPIIEKPEIKFGSPASLSYQIEGNTIELNDVCPQDGYYLHVVLWEKTNGGNRRNPKFYCFSDPVDIALKKESKKFEITAFWCDQEQALQSQAALSAVPETAYCETKNTTPQIKPIPKNIPEKKTVTIEPEIVVPPVEEEALLDFDDVPREQNAPLQESREGENLALLLLEVLSDERLKKSFLPLCISEIRRATDTQNVSFKIAKILRFLNEHNLFELAERRTIADKWRERTLIIDAEASQCFCANDLQHPLSDDLCGLLVDLLFEDETATDTEAKINTQAEVDADQLEIQNFWSSRTEIKNNLEVALRFFRGFSPTQWQGHANNYDGEDQHFIWEREKIWNALIKGEIEGVSDLLQSLRDAGLFAKLSDTPGYLTFAFNPQGQPVMVKQVDKKKNIKTAKLVPNKGTIMGRTICDQQSAQNNSELFSTEFIAPSSQGWNQEAEKIGGRIFAALAQLIALQPKTPMVAARKSASENENLKQQLRSKYLRSLEESSSEVFKIPQYDEDGRLIGLKKITNLEALAPSEKILVRDFVLQIGHEEARAADKKTPDEFAAEIDERITESLKGGVLKEVDKESLTNPGAALARQKQRERHYTEVREFMTLRNKKYLLKRIQATLSLRYPTLKDRIGLSEHDMKEPIHNQTARGLVYEALKLTGIKPSDFFDRNLSYSELVESFNIDGQCWVEWLIDKLESKDITLRPLQEITFSYDEVQSLVTE